MNDNQEALPTQKQMILPLLDALEDAGGSAKTRDLGNMVADRLELTDEQRAQKIEISGKTYPRFKHRHRWAQQKAKIDGLVQYDSGMWSITEKGRKTLTRAQPGQIVTIFTTPSGAFLWGLAEDAIGHVEDNSIAAIWTSPAYPLRRQKAYGLDTGDKSYVDWLTAMVESWLPKLENADSSILINLGDAWEEGMPSISTYQERFVVSMEDRLGLKLAQRFTWHNTQALPGPTLWTCIKRVRVKQATENIWWFSQSGHASADNRRVLQPYAQPQRKADVGKRIMRPSGHAMRGHSFEQEDGGSIPPNILSIANGNRDREYFDRCRENGLPIHPARFPHELAEFFIKLTTKEGDTVLDPFGGSGTTAAVAERLKRRWICFEAMKEYALGARLRFAA